MVREGGQNGVVEAQFRYAALLLQGTYTTKDPVKAEELMKKAAEGGNAMAQFNYGQMLMVKTPGKPGIDLAFPCSRRQPKPNWPTHNMRSARFMPTVRLPFRVTTRRHGSIFCSQPHKVTIRRSSISAAG